MKFRFSILSILLMAALSTRAVQTTGDVNGDNRVDLNDVNDLSAILFSGSATGQYSYVDLGLPSGTLWATMNLGASDASEYGSYIAWGELTEKTGITYDWTTYQLAEGSSSTLLRYCKTESLGKVDNISHLLTSDDAAHAQWGSLWRIPSYTEQTELREKCRWVWYTQNGVNGYLVIGPNNNHIFLPAAGYVDGDYVYSEGQRAVYWSSDLIGNSDTQAYCIYFDKSSQMWAVRERCEGCSIRPVCTPMLKACDVNGDNTVSITDLAALVEILKASKGK